MKRFSVSKALAAALLVILLVSCSKSGSKNKNLIDVKIGIGNTGAAGVLSIIAAEANFDEEFGLNFIIEPIDNASNAIAAVESGKVDMSGWSSAAPLAYIASGNDNLLIIGGIMSNYETFITRPENRDLWSGKLTADFLKGKKIGVNRTNSGDIALRGYFAENGIDLGTITYVELDSPATVIEAVKNGSVDSGIVNGSFFTAAEKQGLVNVRFVRDILGEDFICCRQVVHKDNLAKDPEKWVNVEKALIRAYQFYKNPANQQKVVEYAKTFFLTESPVVQFLLFEYGDLNVEPDPQIKGIEKYYEGMKRCGYIEAGNQVKIADFVDGSAYKKALTELVAASPNDVYLKELSAFYAKYN